MLSHFAYDSVDGGADIDSLCITLSNGQYTPSVRLRLSALKTFITSTVAEDQAARFSDATLHLDLTGVERAFIRPEGVVTDLAYFGLPKAKFDDAPAKPLGGAVTVHATDSLYDYAGSLSGISATTPVSVDLGTGTGRSVTLAGVQRRLRLRNGCASHGDGRGGPVRRHRHRDGPRRRPCRHHAAEQRHARWRLPRLT